MAITGATGPVIGLRVLSELVKASEVHLIVSSGALSILRDEAGVDWRAGDEEEATARAREHFGSGNLRVWSEANMYAPVASGSFITDGMLVVPCTMKTLAGIASGYANGLVERAADVTLKEGRPLVLSPRETPLSAIHLENMLKLARLGVRIVPPMASFYHRPETVGEMVDFFAGKVLDAMGVEHDIFRRWPGRTA
ncbi:MAG: flavin prenyltransferase UbiX [Thermodesulfovibrionales bacterium]